jgi:hypothetical protein
MRAIKVSKNQAFNIHIHCDNIPMDTNKILNALCMVRNVNKQTIIRECLIEYAENHRKEIEELANGGMGIERHDD